MHVACFYTQMVATKCQTKRHTSSSQRTQLYTKFYEKYVAEKIITTFAILIHCLVSPGDLAELVTLITISF